MKIHSVISISGRICSGKSRLATSISQKYGYPIGSFSAYLRSYCASKGKKDDRLTLQETGDWFIREAPREFLENVIQFSSQNSEVLVLEGVRHKVILDELLLITDKRLAIFVDADEDTRYLRYEERLKNSGLTTSFEQFKLADNHRVESEIDDIKILSDIVLDSTRDYKLELDTFIKQNL